MTNRPLLAGAVLFFLVSACSFSGREADLDFCIHNGGDEYCRSRGRDYPYCSLGIPECPGHDSPNGDGCLAFVPWPPECASPCGVGSPEAQSACTDSEASTETVGTTTETAAAEDPVYPSCEPACTSSQVCVTYDQGEQLCSHTCTSDDDCPSPETGNAPAICSSNRCVLDCTDGQTCPDEMTCEDVQIGGSRVTRCVWPPVGP